MSAGNRAIWIDKECELVTFLDIRKEAKADIVCDSTKLPRSVRGPYDLVVFDPPHVNFGKNGRMASRYGHFTTEQIRDTIIGTAKEAHRVTRKEALMAFKWNDHDQKLDKVLAMMDEYWRPLFGQHLKNRGGKDARSQSFWVMLLRRNLKTRRPRGNRQ